MTTTATPRELASALADVFSDVLPDSQSAQDLENGIADAIDQALAAQGAALANAHAYCIDADNEARQQAAMIRAQQEEIAALRAQLEQSMIDLASARRAESNLLGECKRWAEIVSTLESATAELRDEAARQALIRPISTGQIRTNGQPLEPDELADNLITDELAAMKRRRGQGGE
jgi:multidrug efflux pump subunit AcrA (membrane-fusion protein)